MRNIIEINHKALSKIVDNKEYNYAFDINPEYIKDGVTICNVSGTYKGKILDTNLNGNSWQDIKEAIYYGSNPTVWLGQSKEITSGVLAGYHLQLVDLTQGRYQRTNTGTTSQGVFQFVEVLPERYYMDSNTSYPYWSESYMKNTVLPQILQDLPEEIRNIITEVNINSFKALNNTLETTAEKLFLPGEYEIFGVATNTQGIAESKPQYQYFATHNTDAYRIKTQINSTTGVYWWLRTSIQSGFKVVESDGSEAGMSADSLNYIAPCFAI